MSEGTDPMFHRAPSVFPATAAQHASPQSAAATTDGPPPGRHKEVIGFLAIGALSYAVDAGLLWLLIRYGQVDLRIAATVGFWTSVLANFTLNRWLFHRNAAGGLSRHTMRYATLLCVSYLVTLAGLSAAERVGMNILVAKTLLTAVISVWNFVLYRAWVFR
ncbi:GtrA family protein [Cellulomonas fengjieae]|uniref:GtrA family protein n=1 Tax=Cellulomonas fengjieae TaxID=2819978 RepID=UPI001AAF03E6|nr:GtrA family protein [Cellulomonas fengjieae]MBO3101387.1 GtrA family protein [Cellulomonas fengjieae]